jgi:hypothetical protein
MSNTIFSAYYFLKVHLLHFSKIKIQKESQNRRNQGFSYNFCMMIEGSGSGCIPLTSGSGSGAGSGRPKNMWLRWIRIRNTGRNQGFSYWYYFSVDGRIRIRNTAWKTGDRFLILFQIFKKEYKQLFLPNFHLLNLRSGAISS